MNNKTKSALILSIIYVALLNIIAIINEASSFLYYAKIEGNPFAIGLMIGWTLKYFIIFFVLIYIGSFLLKIIKRLHKKIKINFVGNQSQPNAVAYLLFYILMFLFIFGIVYSLLSDIRDFFPPLFNSLSAQTEYMDADYVWGFDVLNFLLSFSAAFAVIGLIWYSYSLATKPNIPW